MKDFNLEDLKRENVFTHQDPSFEAMQQHVLQNIAPSRRIGRMNWAYAAAAAVALIFGFTFLQGPENENTVPTTQQNSIAQINTPDTAEKLEPTEEAVALKTLEEDLTSVRSNHPKNRAAVKAKDTDKTHALVAQERAKTKPDELQMDQILSNFSRAELADIAQNAEQDIYLDLYN